MSDRAAELTASSVDGMRGVRLWEEAFRTQIDVRLDTGSPAVARIERALGVALPHREPNRACGDEQHAVLWLGPDEWLLVGPDGWSAPASAMVRTAMGEAHGSVVDVSANRTTLRLSGPMARAVLEKVCAVDLHPRAFGPGRCVQTLVGRTQAVLWQVSAEPAYRLLVRGSFAGYLADLLLDAMAEFQAE